MSKITIIRALDESALSEQVDDRIVASIVAALGHPNYNGSFILTDSTEEVIQQLGITQFPTIILISENESGIKTVVARLVGNVSESALLQATQRALNGETIGSYYYDQDGNGTRFNGSENGEGFGLSKWSGSKLLWLLLAGVGAKRTVQADSSVGLIVSGSAAVYGAIQFLKS